MKSIIGFLCILILCSFQPTPKWKWTVHWKEWRGSRGMGIETMKEKTEYHTKSFTNSSQAWSFFWDRIRHRNNPVKLPFGGEPDIKRNVRIDSVLIK